MGIESLFDKKEEAKVKRPEDILNENARHLIPFGIPPLDIILGGGGLPAGKIIEVSGWEGSGKTTFAIETAKAFSNYWNATDEGNYAILWIESESNFDAVRARWMGLDTSSVRIFPADFVEEGFDQIEQTLTKCLDKGIHLLIVWDTIAAAPTENEKPDEDEKEKGQYAGGMMEKPRIIRQRLRNITNPLGESGSILLFVNQLYQVPAKGKASGGPSEETPGGKGIKFHAAIRLQMVRKEDLVRILPSGEPFSEGIITEVYTLKNKIILQHQRCPIALYGERGFDKAGTMIRFLKKAKMISTSGSWSIIDFLGKEVKFQNAAQLKELTDNHSGEYGRLEDYMDYLVYRNFSTYSPLIKVKIIKKLWEYENMFFGQKKTELIDRELEVAAILYNDLQREEDEAVS